MVARLGGGVGKGSSGAKPGAFKSDKPHCTVPAGSLYCTARRPLPKRASDATRGNSRELCRRLCDEWRVFVACVRGLVWLVGLHGWGM